MTDCRVCGNEIVDKYKGGIGICYDCNSGWILTEGDKTEADALWVDFVKFKGWDVQTIPHNALYMKELAAYVLGRLKKEQETASGRTE
ncbi:MAG: hypothetical protein Q8R00_03120 [Candidatus Nanoarchaeia archaeon]|nr:hypothetical protein [Candidatus Nanoarchaeia archaeon]